MTKKVELYTNNELFDDLKVLKEEIKSSRPGIYSWDQFVIYFIVSWLFMKIKNQLESRLFLNISCGWRIGVKWN